MSDFDNDLKYFVTACFYAPDLVDLKLWNQSTVMEPSSGEDIGNRSNWVSGH